MVNDVSETDLGDNQRELRSSERRVLAKLMALLKWGHPRLAKTGCCPAL